MGMNDRSEPGLDADAEFGRRLRDAAALLEAIVADRGLLARVPAEDRRRVLAAAGNVYNPDVHARRRMVKATIRGRKAARIRRDDSVLADTGIRSLRRKPVFTTPNALPPNGFDTEDTHREHRHAADAQNCYVCKQDYTAIHHFYDQLCPPCAELNFSKRTELADLGGRVALLTGGRVKIGYQTGLKLLRCGAHLIVTTRFPRDSASRYAQEPDFEDWQHRLEIFGLDLRHTPSVEAFCRELLARHTRLDYIVNNACQTVRRPPDFYAHMMAKETASLAGMPSRVRRLVGTYEGVRGYRVVLDPESALAAPALLGDRIGGAAGLTHAAEMSQVALLPDEVRGARRAVPGGPARSGPAAGRSARAQLVAAPARRSVLGRAAGSAPRERDRALRHERAAQAVDAADPGARQAHRQRLRRRGTVLPEVQDHAPSPHEHGQGGAQHDDANLRRPTTMPTAFT